MDDSGAVADRWNAPLVSRHPRRAFWFSLFGPVVLRTGVGFERLRVPVWYQLFFPCGLGALVLFAGIGYLFPLPPGLDPFYYWTRGWPKVLALVGLGCLVAALLWTAGVLAYYAVHQTPAAP